MSMPAAAPPPVVRRCRRRRGARRCPGSRRSIAGSGRRRPRHRETTTSCRSISAPSRRTSVIHDIRASLMPVSVSDRCLFAVLIYLCIIYKPWQSHLSPSLPPPSTLSFSIFYFPPFSFRTRLIYFLAFSSLSILPE